MGEAARKFALNFVRFSGLASLLAPAMGGMGAILMLHRVTGQPAKPLRINGHLAIQPEFLDAVLDEVKELGYALVSMDEIVEALKRRKSGSGRILTITADDAYRDNLVEALPVLESHDAPITIYAAPGLTEGKADLWWDVLEDVVTASDEIAVDMHGAKTVLDCSTDEKKREAFCRLDTYLTSVVVEEERQPVLCELAARAGVDPQAPSRDTLMDWEELSRAASHPLVTVGAHTIHHYNLKRLDEDEARREMTESARILAERLGARPVHFAYPYGYERAVGEREVRLAGEAGFHSAVTTRHGVLQADHARHLHALPRISINGRYQSVGYVRTMLSGVTTRLANGGKSLVTV